MVTATPEGVSVEVVLAGAGSRFGAIMLDSLVQLVLLWACLFGAGAIVTAVTSGSPSSGPILAGVLSVVAFLVLFGYFIVLEALTGGRTLGKLAAGLRAVRLDGQPIGFRRSVVRTMLRLIDVYLTLGMVGLGCIVGTPRNQRLGDLAAGTIVIRERRAATTRVTTVPAMGVPGVPGQPVPILSAYAEPLDARGWDVTAVTSDEAVLAERFLRSRFGYTTPARTRLAARLANQLAPKVAGAPIGLPAEQFLEGVVAAKTGAGWAVPVWTSWGPRGGPAVSTTP
jgi:uncharacterized RDD family membrane protein YckC